MELDSKVVLSPGTFVQYQSIQAKQAWYEMYPKKSVEDEMEEVVHETEFFFPFKPYLWYQKIFSRSSWV
jgi:hypothetical protein